MLIDNKVRYCAYKVQEEDNISISAGATGAGQE
jgi:hypothetical protein